MKKTHKINVKDRVDENACDLSLSELNDVPVREIATFKRVTILDLSSNRLVSLNKNFPILTQLVKLDLSKNQIKYLPYDFGLLRNLRHLDLYDNKLVHLPLSFGDLNNLRYLDLKGNPLLSSIIDIVGLCLTTKECQDAARKAVPFFQTMQIQAKRTMEKYANKKTEQNNTNEGSAAQPKESKPNETQKSKKSKRKSRSKNKKSSNNNNDAIKAMDIASTNADNNKLLTKLKKPGTGTAKKTKSKSSTALTSILTFCLLLGLNVLIIYMVMFNNPDIADKLVEIIPSQYRNWILAKAEFFRLRVTDWISQFLTLPDEQ